jgi:hypothetical protein
VNIRRFVTLHARLLFAWSKASRTHVKRSVAQKFAVRTPRSNKIKAVADFHHGPIPPLMQPILDDDEHEKAMRAVESAMRGER